MNRSITTTSLRSHTAVASGFLHKLTHNGTPFARWHQRYYVLYSDGLLCSYKSSRSRNSHRVIHVGRKCLRLRFGLDTRNDECSRWPKSCPRTRCFSVINSDREYHFYCESDREFAIWRKSLQQILAKLGSAHSSYVERRGSKLNGVASYSWLDGNDSSPEPTPSSSRKLRPWAEGRKEFIQELIEKDTRDEPAVLSRDTHEMATNDAGHEDTNVNGYDNLSSCELAERGSLKEICWMDNHRAPEGNSPVPKGQITSYGTASQTQENVLGKLSTNATSRAALEVTGYSSVHSIDAAFLEVQNIIDETFNDMC